MGAEVIGKLNPGHQVVKIVGEELTALMGGSSGGLSFSPRPPTVILMAGLQGSGKTTATAKLARYLREEHSSTVAVAACDVYRPAAVEQLVKVGAQAGAEVYEQGTDRDPVEIAKWALERAKTEGKDVLIVDTSGRLHVDEQLMAELVRIRDAVKPHNVLLVVDAMTGQDAVNVAESFAEAVQFDGVIMSKLDGDARGGAALSIRQVTGKPIKFASEGEKPESLEPFYPDRMAKRILGMGDVVSLIEKAQEAGAAEMDEATAERMKRAEFTLDDFLSQIKQVRKMGGLGGILKSLPGAGKLTRELDGEVDESALDRIEAIIFSMTAAEREKPVIINGSRRERIATGSGVQVYDVNQLLKQFADTRKLMKQFQSSSGKGKKRMRLPGMPPTGF